MTMKRRDALKAFGTLAGAAGSAKLLSGCRGSPSELATGPGTIDTFVFVMMENRSYDHYLGVRSLMGKPGDGLVAGMSNPDLAGNPVEIWPASDDLLCTINPPHGWGSSHDQFAGGDNSGFVTSHQSRWDDPNAIEPMQYLTAEQLPVHHALADAHVSCDRWFCSVMGPTLPNRMYWHAGTSKGAVGNFEAVAEAFEGVTSLYHRLDAAGVDWAYYFSDIPVLAALENIDIEGRMRRFLWDFIDDAAAGALPPVAYIDPGFAWNDDHPPHHPLLGQQFLSMIYHALATSPQWERCMLVITYDEHGGFFDHVPPPTTTDEHADLGFDQLGFRVPTVIAGPYVKQGYVSSVTYDHTSAIKHLESLYGLEPLTQRITAATDLADVIDVERLQAGQPAAPAEVPAIEVDESQLPASCSNPKTAPEYDHDVIEWAHVAGLGKWHRPDRIRDYGYGIGDYLDRHDLGRIRRGR